MKIKIARPLVCAILVAAIFGTTAHAQVDTARNKMDKRYRRDSMNYRSGGKSYNNNDNDKDTNKVAYCQWNENKNWREYNQSQNMNKDLIYPLGLFFNRRGYFQQTWIDVKRNELKEEDILG
jgi:hypothetical protein